MSPDISSYLGQGDFVYREGKANVFAYADRCMLVDTDGHRFLDGEAANGTVALGYDAAILRDAADEAARVPAIPSFLESTLRLDVAERLAEWFRKATGASGRVAFEIGGAQGIELALKIARSQNQGDAVAVFEGAYHGRSVYTSFLSASSRYRQHNLVSSPNILRLPYPDYPCSTPGAVCDGRCIAALEEILSNDMRGAPRSFFAFLFEPMLNVGGMIRPCRHLINAAVTMFRERGAVIIADEIFTGFYRMGAPLGITHHDIVPDIIVVSKGLSNGLVPLACVWARDPLLSADRFVPGSHSVTYANNTFNMAVASAVLRRFQEWETVQQDVTDIETSLNQVFENLKRRHPLISAASAIGATGRIVLHQPIAAQIRKHARSSNSRPISGFDGVILSSTGMAPNVLAVHPPLIISNTEIEALGALLDQTLSML